MSGTRGVLCRYYLHGACKFGSACAFSHSLEDSESQVCRYYLQGSCAYGDSCRYMHVKPDWSNRAGNSGNNSSSYVPPTGPRPAADSLADQMPISRLRLGGQAAGGSSDDGSSTRNPRPAGSAAKCGRDKPLPLPLPLDPFVNSTSTVDVGSREQAGGEAPAWPAEPVVDEGEAAGAAGEWEEEAEQEEYWEEEGEQGEYWEEGNEGGEYWEEEGEEGEEEYWQHGQGQQHTALQTPAAGQEEEQQAWALPAGSDGSWPWGAGGGSHPSLRSLCMQYFSSGACQRGDRCTLVHGDLCEHCHKYALHPADPTARQHHLEECQLRHERLAARARSAGIECGICLEAVLGKAALGERKFGLLTGCDHPFCLHCIRSWRQKTDAGADIDTALRTCPICRQTSYYIVPSLTWPTSAQEKERIVAGYKAKLGTIDCRFFNFGEGSCPFSTSCFYRHAYPDGRLEEVSLRKAADEEGNIRVMQPVRLSDFISISTAGQRMLAGGRRR